MLLELWFVKLIGFYNRKIGVHLIVMDQWPVFEDRWDANQENPGHHDNRVSTDFAAE